MNFVPTDLPPGSVEKIELMRLRHDKGLPVFHKNDRVDCEGLSGGVIVRTQGKKGAYRCVVKAPKSRKMLGE